MIGKLGSLPCSGIFLFLAILDPGKWEVVDILSVFLSSARKILHSLDPAAAKSQAGRVERLLQVPSSLSMTINPIHQLKSSTLSFPGIAQPFLLLLCLFHITSKAVPRPHNNLLNNVEHVLHCLNLVEVTGNGLQYLVKTKI